MKKETTPTTNQIEIGELETLTKVIDLMIQDNFSEYTTKRVENTKEEELHLSNLINKCLIYDCYEGMQEGFKMYCATDAGLELAVELGINISHIELIDY
jgi:hypothetical protein